MKPTRWTRDGRPQPHFDVALWYLAPELNAHALNPIRYHDKLNPLPSPKVLLDALSNGAVVIPSFETCNPGKRGLVQRGRWHMLSLFNPHDDRCQVWDTNPHQNRNAFFLHEDLEHLFVGEFPPIPYGTDERNGQPQLLTSHDQHEVIVVPPRSSSAVAPAA